MDLKEFEPEYIDGSCEPCYNDRTINKIGINRAEYRMIMCGSCLKRTKDVENSRNLLDKTS
jgi:hypothetical protein